ncbi:MAG: class 1 fructose-bisphosphatase [Rhodobacterales bacterium]|nr:class 1 fructose-bisphosphatase [Rhodobacterales bacterium]
MAATDRIRFSAPGSPPDVEQVLERLARAAAELAWLIQSHGIDSDLAAARGVNSDGDGQKALDVIADDLFREMLETSPVRHYASEEQEEALTLNAKGSLAVAIDPLDGSSNIDVNVSIGTIFSIFPAAATPEDSFLRNAGEQLAAGYIIYGPQCVLAACWGHGVHLYVLDTRTRVFTLIRSGQMIPEDSSEFSINASNYRHWPAPVRAYIDDCVAGADGPRGRNFNMRWIASLVAETHRILTRGGIFLYPADDRKGYERGRLRHVYECAPIAKLICEAGGGATDGSEPILSQTPARLHARTPFVFGSAAKVARVASYHDLPPAEASALFGKRGLFRS